MYRTIGTGIALLFSAAAIGQNSAEQTKNADAASRESYLGQSWVGLLVSGDCQAGAGRSARKPETRADREANLSVGQRVTTPAVDSAGTRGDSSEPAHSAQSPGVPRLGDVMAHSAPAHAADDPGWRKAKSQAGALAKTCRVDANTTSFSLLLPDGRSVAFAPASNARVAEQLKSAGFQNGPALLRVQVTGKMENGTLAMDGLRY